MQTAPTRSREANCSVCDDCTKSNQTFRFVQQSPKISHPTLSCSCCPYMVSIAIQTRQVFQVWQLRNERVKNQNGKVNKSTMLRFLGSSLKPILRVFG